MIINIIRDIKIEKLIINITFIIMHSNKEHTYYVPNTRINKCNKLRSLVQNISYILLVLAVLSIIGICLFILYKKENNIHVYYQEYDDKFKYSVLYYYNKYVNRYNAPQNLFVVANKKLSEIYKMNIIDIISSRRCGLRDDDVSHNIDVCKNNNNDIIYYKIDYTCTEEQSIIIHNTLKLYSEFNIMFYVGNDYKINIFCNYSSNNEFGNIIDHKSHLSITVSDNIKNELNHILSHIFIGKHKFEVNSYAFLYYWNIMNMKLI
ncbi:unknown similar to AMEVITR05 [Choristoneura biennis entomopoxvirus]|uniref:Uncharacterized protein n=1 Tax=Choristoneura biennis entomopoxvirus TaxID=10288 RepID=A0A916NY44_CBEPV|nr:unknown similar to AMEVITR05 [Choristoneura biennis entomopoxvirus]CCU55872.1 unknown similar to AMEVITR05 [Choristoneura biennis entomopoxvirus]